MIGARIAILGAGRSGLAVARAAKNLGAFPKLYDQKPLGPIEGIPSQGNFKGPFKSTEADILVTSPGVDSRSPILQNAKKDGIEVMSEIEFAYRIAKSPIIAITGTNGKSTTTVMTWTCLTEILGEGNAFLCGNIYGSGYQEQTLVEAAAIAQPDQVLVAEISSFQLEWVQQFQPRCAAITNITQDHLNRYDSFEEYANTKRRIYARMDKGDTYVHHNDPMTNPPTNSAFLDLPTRLDEDFIFVGKEKYQPWPGTQNAQGTTQHLVQNAAIAATLTYAFLPNAKSDQILEGLRAFKGLAHRMEKVGERDSIQLINNSMCTNPSAVVVSSAGVRSHQHLLMGGLTKDLDFSPVREYLRASGHEAYIFGADASKINLQLGGFFPVFRTMEEAFNAAIANAKPGNVVMLAPGCASMDQYQDFRARGDEFKQLAKEWLHHDQIATR